MQIMPATGAEQHVGDIAPLEPNTHARVQHMRFMIDRYYKDEPMDAENKALFASERIGRETVTYVSYL